MPVALPGPEEQSPAKGNARPAIGPVVPLNATAGGEGGELVGAASHPAQNETDPLATRVLSRGDAIPAPPGRADDFSWPRADAQCSAAANAAPEPMTPAPAHLARPKGAGRQKRDKQDRHKRYQQIERRQDAGCSQRRAGETALFTDP